MKTIKLGSIGEDVKVLQKYLGINADGIFGLNTYQKVKAWQKSKGLKVDGIVGNASWEIILEKQNKTNNIKTTPKNETSAITNSINNTNSTNSPKLTKQTTTNKTSKYNNVGISKEMINFICKYETGKQFGYVMGVKDLNGYDLKDAKGHLTYGYGILYHPTQKKYMDEIKKVWTQKELEDLFLEHIKKTSNAIDKWANTNKVKLNQNQKDAIASAYYNFGAGFLKKQICKAIIENPNNPAIRNTWEHLSDAQGKKYPGLIKRRQAEAKWYFEGK